MSTAKYMKNQGKATSSHAQSRGDERGFALLLTIFGLLLLTAVAMAMLFSSDSETSIAVNYRDSESSSYSAMSGVQEARDRLHPLFGDLATAGFVPTNTPDAAGGYVLYIVNPNTQNNETVAGIAPWSPLLNGKANPYFDQELCQEGMLGVARGAAGVACAGAAAVPAGGCKAVGGAAGNWCYYYDNSANGTNWNLKDANGNAIPLDYKWVRVTMKEDWNTLVYVPSPLAAVGKQVCWDGNYQNPIPGGYTTNCQPVPGNQVIAVNVVSAGAGFTTAPTVTISGGGGSGATAVANMGTSLTGAISSALPVSPGSGYTSAPTVSFASPPDGTGAQFQAVITGAPVTAVSVNNTGTNYCYQSNVVPTISLATVPTTNTISNGTPTVNMTSNGCIAQISSTSGSCVGGASTTQTFTSSAPGTGSNFAGTVTFNAAGAVTGTTITNSGSGYTAGTPPPIAFSGGHGVHAWSCSISATFTTGQQVSSVSVPAGQGGEYMSAPTATLIGTPPQSPTTPVKPTLGVTWSAAGSIVKAINITASGSGYQQPTYSLVLTGGGGTGATGTARSGSTNIVSSFTVTNGGAGYTTAPTVTISGGGGSGTTATSTIASGGTTTSMGQIYLLTSMAVTKNGTKSMAQMEAAARPPFYFNLGGALTLAGPEPAADFTSANSQNFTINGADANSCTQAAAPTKPAIGVYDSASQTNVINALGKQANYTGAGGTPSVENVYTAIGGASATPSALDGFVADMAANATWTSTQPTTTSLPATTTGSVTVVNGDLTLSGNPNGSGILIITGTLTFSGDFTWNGLVLIIGQGTVVHNGGGNGSISGAIYVAQTKDANGNELAQLGNPNFTWNGGGVNNVKYDHCLADNLLKKYVGQPSGLPLQVLSTRILEF